MISVSFFFANAGRAFASDEFQPVDSSLLVTSFSMTKSEKDAQAKADKTIFSKSYRKLVSTFQYVRNSEARSQTLRNLCEASSFTNFTSISTESSATSHVQLQLKRGFDYSMRSELRALSTFTREFDLFAGTQTQMDPIRYDLVATEIKPRPNQYYLAALRVTDFDVLQHIEEDDINWTIEPVRIKANSKGVYLPSRHSLTKFNTSLRLSSPNEDNIAPGMIFSVSTLDNFYQMNVYSAPAVAGQNLTHTLTLPTDYTTLSSELNATMNFNRVSLVDVARLGKNTWLNLSYYNHDQDVRAEFVIRQGLLPVTLSAIVSMD